MNLNDYYYYLIQRVLSLVYINYFHRERPYLASLLPRQASLGLVVASFPIARPLVINSYKFYCGWIAALLNSGLHYEDVKNEILEMIQTPRSLLGMGSVVVLFSHLIHQLVGPHPLSGYNPSLREEDCLGYAFVLMFLLSAICFHLSASFVFVYIAIMADPLNEID
jgi:cation transporter-like permease